MRWGWEVKKGQCIYLWRANGSTEFGNGVKYGASQPLNRVPQVACLAGWNNVVYFGTPTSGPVRGMTSIMARHTHGQF